MSGKRVQRRTFWDNTEKVTEVWRKLHNMCCSTDVVTVVKLSWQEWNTRAHIHQITNKLAQNYNSTAATHIYNVYAEARLNLCTLDSSQMVTRVSCFMLLFTFRHIYYRMLLQLLVHFCRKLHLIQPFYNFWLTTNNVILNLLAYSNSMYIPNFIYLHINNKY